MAFLPGLIAGAGALAGGAFSAWGQHSANESNERIGEQNNEFSAQQAQLNRDFQERMSNTSWTRGVSGMREAGINPMLAVSQGGASSPSGNSAQGIATANQQNELANISSSAQQAAQLYNQTRETDSRIALNDATIAKVTGEAKTANARSEIEQVKGALWSIVNRQMPHVVSTANGIADQIPTFSSTVLKNSRDAFSHFKQFYRNAHRR